MTSVPRIPPANRAPDATEALAAEAYLRYARELPDAPPWTALDNATRYAWATAIGEVTATLFEARSIQGAVARLKHRT